MKIHSKFKTYEVQFIPNINILNNYKKEATVFWIIDHQIFHLYKTLFEDIAENQLLIIEATEKNKTIETALHICEIMSQLPSKRNTTLISIGGGIIQDITGFAANILYRGIKWIFVPTTLLAATDSCIGSKTSLNYKSFKNLLGTFYPPDVVFIWTTFFKTLSNIDFNSGLGEVVKFNVMAGKNGIVKLEKDLDKLLDREENILTQYIKNGLLFKKHFIEEDEFDKGIRILLNFAHTFGHALETVSHYAIPHGQAVAIGMLIANHISMQRNLLNKLFVERVNSQIIKIINVDVKPEYFNLEKIITSIKKDKKQMGNTLTAILMDEDMNLKLYNDIGKDEIHLATEEVLNLLFESHKEKKSPPPKIKRFYNVNLSGNYNNYYHSRKITIAFLKRSNSNLISLLSNNKDSLNNLKYSLFSNF